MPNITADDERHLAHLLYEMSRTLDDYRFDNWNTLSSEARSRLEVSATRLRDCSSDLIIDAITTSIHNLGPELARLKSGTKRLKDDLAQLNQVRDLLDFAAAGVQLGIALTSGNAFAVASALDAIDNLQFAAPAVVPG